MKLLTKFNLILLVLFGGAGLIISQLSYTYLNNNARREVLQQAELMMASATSVRNYTALDLKPLLEQTPEHQKKFLPETVPAFGAISTFNKLKTNYPDYSYHEATLNPTNPVHRATDWESDIILFLREHPDQKQFVGQRDTPTGPSLYLASPIKADASCMECHSVPSAAPAAMLATYGSNNGFGWKPGVVVAAQIVSVPMSVPVENAQRAYHLLLIDLAITLIVTILVLDAGVYLIVIRPLKRVSDAADRASKGEKDVPALQVKGRDEIATVTASFNRMQVSLAKAFKMLE